MINPSAFFGTWRKGLYRPGLIGHWLEGNPSVARTPLRTIRWRVGSDCRVPRSPSLPRARERFDVAPPRAGERP